MATNPERVEHRKLVNQMVEEAFGAWETDELLAELDRIGVPAGRIRSIDEVYDWEQTRSQGLLVDVDHDTLGPITPARTAAAVLHLGRRRNHPHRTRRTRLPRQLAQLGRTRSPLSGS